MASVASLLLRISGDDREADSALERLSRSLDGFGKKRTEAQADVNTSAGKSKVDELAEKLAGVGRTAAEARVDVQVAAAEAELGRVTDRLERLSQQEASPQVTLATARAFAQAERIEAKIAKLRTENVEVDVTIDQDGAASSAAARLAANLGGLRGSVDTTSKTFGALGIPVSAARGALVLAIPVAAGLGSALLALVPAIVSAGTALGAMGIAAGGVFAAVKLLAAGGMAQFERDSEKAGTTANTFAKSLNRTRDALIDITSGGVDAVFARLGPAMENAAGRAGVLRGAFTNLGNQAATAGERLLSTFTNPEFLGGFSNIINSAGGAFKPLTTIVESFGRVLLTIAQAAMPLLIRTLEAAAAKAKSFAEGFGSVDSTQSKLAGMFGTLKQLGQILLNLGSAVVGVFKAFSVGTGGAVTGLEKGTAALARFTNGSGFKEGVQTMLGVLKDFATFAFNVGRIVVGAFKLIAPAFEPIRAALQLGAKALGDFVNSGSATSKLTPIFKAIGTVLSTAIEYGVDVFKRLVEAIKPAQPILAPLAAFIGGALKGAFAALKPVLDVAIFAIGLLARGLGAIGTVLTPFTGLIGKFGEIVGVVFGGGIVGAVGKVLSAFGKLPGFLAPIFGTVGKVLETFGSVLSAIGGVATRVVEAAILPLGIAFKGAGATIQVVAGAIASIVTSAFNAVASVTSTVWNGVKTVITTVVGAIRTYVETYIAVVKTVITTAWNVIKTVTSTVWNAIKTVISTVFDAIASAVNAALGVLKSIVSGAWNAIKSVTSTVWNAIKSVVSGAFGAIADFVSDGLERMKRGFERIWGGFKTVVRDAFNGVKDAVSAGIGAALDVITGLGSRFFEAGKALIENVIGGVKSLAGKLYDTMKGALGPLGKLLPGSEPKDTSSPLRGLAHRGEAMLQNFADGIPAGAAKLRSALAGELAVLPQLTVQASGRAVSAAGAGAAPSSTTIQVSAPQVVGAGLPDPDHWMAGVEQAIRSSGGLALAP